MIAVRATEPEPVLSPLAVAIYKLLVRRLRMRTPELTYTQLVASLGTRHSTHRRSPALHEAIAEVVQLCRARGLPCLPALVQRVDTGHPGPAYFRAAHPKARSETARMAAWEAEVVAVLAALERY